MVEIETVSFSCPNCGKRLRARAEQAGRIYACPGCGGPVPVPALTAPAAPAAQVSLPPEAGGLLTRPPATVGELALFLFIAWSAVAFVCLIAAFFGDIARYVGIIAFLLVTLEALRQGWLVLRARQRVLVEKDVPLLWGTTRLIAWEPTEGILILKDKAIDFSDDDLHDAKGGVRLLRPMLGEELALRVPLETQTLSFEDKDVLTREYLHLVIRGTMKWRIDDIEKFYLLVSRELREVNETNDPMAVRLPRTDRAGATSRKLIDASIAWLRGIAQEQTRIVVSRVRSGLLIADKVVADVPEVRQSEATPELGGAAEGLASAIHEAVAQRLSEYGITVAEVSLVEIRMPQAIIEQCVAAAKTAYLPLMAKNQASTRRAELQADASVIGRDAVAAREVISAAPAYALRDFLTDVVAKNATQPGSKGPVATIDIAKLSAIEHADDASARSDADAR
jgi:DNA-directed RNA polymerase subunit RPC12/RpoP